MSSSLLLGLALFVITSILIVIATNEVDRGVVIGTSIAMTVVSSLALWGFYYYGTTIVQTIPNTILFLGVAVLVHILIITAISAMIFEVDFDNILLPYIPVGLVGLAACVILVMDFERTSYYKSATSQISKEDAASLLEYNEEHQKIAMAPRYAKYLFGKSMNQVPNSEFYEINSVQIQVIDGKIHYVADLAFTSFFRWNETKTLPGYFILDASSTTSKVEFVEYEYQYASSAYFGRNAERAIRQANKEDYFVGNPTIEIDDEGKVFYTMTLADAINLQSGYELNGIYLLDAKTGKGTHYKKDEIPEWIDGGISPEYAYNVANNYATWNQGRFNFSNSGQKSLNSNGEFGNMKPILIENQLHYMIEFSTLKNAGNNSMIGYLVMNTNTGEFYVNETKEDAFIDSSGATSQAEKVFIEKKYDSKNPMLYNIEGNLGWVTSLHDGDGLFQSFYIVSASNPSIAGSGKTIELAIDNFIKNTNSNTSTIVNEEDVEDVTKTITIAKVVTQQADGYHYVYLQDTEGKMFVHTSETANPIIFVAVGDSLSVTYKDLGKDVINAISSYELK